MVTSGCTSDTRFWDGLKNQSIADLEHHRRLQAGLEQHRRIETERGDSWVFVERLFGIWKHLGVARNLHAESGKTFCRCAWRLPCFWYKMAMPMQTFTNPPWKFPLCFGSRLFQSQTCLRNRGHLSWDYYARLLNLRISMPIVSGQPP